MNRISATKKENINQPKWRSKNGDIPMSEMDKEYLQTAKKFSQERIIYFTNMINTFDKKVEELEEEAERRGIRLLDLDELKPMGTYFANERMLKSKMNK